MVDTNKIREVSNCIDSLEKEIRSINSEIFRIKEKIEKAKKPQVEDIRFMLSELTEEESKKIEECLDSIFSAKYDGYDRWNSDMYHSNFCVSRTKEPDLNEIHYYEEEEEEKVKELRNTRDKLKLKKRELKRLVS